MRGLTARLSALTLRRQLALAALSGAVGGLGLPPFNLPLLALAGFAGIALIVGQCATVRAAFLTGLAAGTGYFAVSLHWIVEPFFVDPWRHGWMAPFALIFMSAGLALFWGLAAWGARRLAPPGAARALAFAMTLSLAELARAYLLTGFPWAHPGHIWVGGPLMGLAAWIGPHGLTLMTLLCASGFAAAIWHRPLLAILPAGVLAAGFGGVALMPDAPEAMPEAPVIRLVQPNAPQHLKWRRDMIPVFFDRALRLTAEPAQLPRPADLVIWPETSLPAILSESEPWREAIGLAASDAAIIVGGQRFEAATVRNSLFVLEPGGALAAVYDKHRLVPFGEYIPLTAAARALGLRGLAEVMGAGYSPGPGPRVLDLGPLGRVFPMICYETIFPQDIHRVERPDWMVQITNDAWFGQVSGPFQHLELAQLRAAEQGLPLLRAANTGVSAVIDARGQIVAALPMGEAGALDTHLPPPLPPTLYSRTGDWPALVLLLVLTFGLVLRQRHLRH